MSRFVSNAVSLLDAADSAFRAGHTPSDMTILISPEGGIRMIADSDWPIESLQAHHGAKMAYRVSQHQDKVRIEGKSGSRTCMLESSVNDEARRLLGWHRPSVEASVRAPQLLLLGR